MLRTRVNVANFVRTSKTKNTAALRAKSLLNAVMFFAVFMVALIWFADRLAPRRIPLPFWPRAVLAPLMFVGGLAVWLPCADLFARRGRGTPLPLDAPRNLVTTGPFGVIRNPIITGEIAVVWGIALYLSSLGVLLYAILFALAGHWAVVKVEEPELRKRFGKQYEDYCRRVPRWLPRLSGAR
jgi:protein-S-isoprenylcysteine O-methyltransferase Ste14